MKPKTQVIVARIVALKEEGLSNTVIGARLGIGKTSVARIWRNYKAGQVLVAAAAEAAELFTEDALEEFTETWKDE